MGSADPDKSGLPGAGEPALSIVEEVSLRYNFFPFLIPEGSGENGRKSFSAPYHAKREAPLAPMRRISAKVATIAASASAAPRKSYPRSMLLAVRPGTNA